MKKILAYSVALSAIFVMSGCGGGNSGDSANGQAHVAFSKHPSPRVDALFKTDGTSAGIVEGDWDRLTDGIDSLQRETIDNVEIYGDYVYYTATTTADPGVLLPEIKARSYRNKVTNNETEVINESHSPMLDADKRFKTSNGLYMFEIEGRAIFKYASNGIRTDYEISLPHHMIPASDLGKVVVGDIIYFGVRVQGSNISDLESYGVAKFDTTNNTFAMVIGLKYVKVGRMHYSDDGNKLYINATTNASGSGIYAFHLDTPSIPPVLLIENVYANKNFLLYDGDIYVIGQTINTLQLGLYLIKPDIDHGYTTMVTGTSVGRETLFAYHNAVYAVIGGKLWWVDGDHELQGIMMITYSPNIDGHFVEANDKVYFAHTESGTGFELYALEHNHHVALAHEIAAGTDSSYPSHLTELDGNIVFQATEDGVDNGLYKYDTNTDVLTTLY